ncbi:MAG: DUF6498-containing protein [Opitutaceae bacterium]|nr:DUF6498-containing protein [Opitutaceae bacterium]
MAPPGWLDAAGFAAGLLLAWLKGWQTTDLVWSLWLSSLVVGFTLIVWSIAGPAIVRLPQIWRDRGFVAASLGDAIPAGAISVLGGLFLLAFFTVHFGGFHFGHSVFLASFFPIEPGRGLPGWATYAEVVARYWVWLPVAFLAERSAFRRVPKPAAKQAKARPKAVRNDGALLAPYKNVVRMHLLIFFFAGAHFAGLDNFAVYAVVYAVYFFPWAWLWSKRAAARS